MTKSSRDVVVHGSRKRRNMNADLEPFIQHMSYRLTKAAILTFFWPGVRHRSRRYIEGLPLSTRPKINIKHVRLSGTSIIGFRRGEQNGNAFYAFNPGTAASLHPAYHPANRSEVDRAVLLASEAFEQFRHTTPQLRAAFLRTIAESIERLGE